MSNPKRAMDAIERAARIGIGLVLDDFGTGYSSLTYLRAPARGQDQDRQVVRRAHGHFAVGSVIVRSLIDLAHDLGLRVIAEGVENELVCRELTELGCDAAQGFYLSTPRPAAELTRWLEELDATADRRPTGRDAARSRLALSRRESPPA